MKIILLDRDGIINEDKGYVHKIEDFQFKEGIFNLIQYLISLDYKIYITTNQTGIGKEYYTLKDFFDVTKYMMDEFEKRNCHIENVFFCPHDPDENCGCRKPAIGMVKKLFEQNKIDKKHSYMIGDKDSDVLFGINLGIQTIRLKSQYQKEINHADFLVENLSEIQKIIN